MNSLHGKLIAIGEAKFLFHMSRTSSRAPKLTRQHDNPADLAKDAPDDQGEFSFEAKFQSLGEESRARQGR
jgi:hypothetical protein